MEWVETTGRTIEEAREAALDELGVDEHDAEFEVLEQPKVGLFGRVRVEARVRARVRPTTPRAKEERRDRRRRGRTGTASPRAGSGPAPREDTAGEDSAAETSDGSARRVTDGGGERASAPPAGDSETGTGTGGSRSRRSRRRRSGGGSRPPVEGTDPEASTRGARDPASADRAPAGARVGASGASAARSAETPDPADPDAASPEPSPAGRGPRRAGRSRTPNQPSRRPSTEADDDDSDRIGAEGGNLMDVALEEQGAVAQQFLEGLLGAFGLQADIGVHPDVEEDRVEITVDGDNLGLLIGPKGATLLAIQDLTRTVVQYKTSARNGRLFVDISGYRERRALALTGFVKKIAADVLAAGRPIALEPMSAADRKLVHDTIIGVDGVETRSEGEDERRHVVIAPEGYTAEERREPA